MVGSTPDPPVEAKPRDTERKQKDLYLQGVDEEYTGSVGAAGSHIHRALNLWLRIFG